MSELYALPEGWEWKNIGETCENLDRLRKPISQKDRVSGIYPYYGATKIVDYINDYIFDEQLILIGEDGAKWDIGDETAFIAKGKYWVNNHAHVIKPNRNILNDSWLVYYLYVTDLSDYITGTTVPKLNQTKLKEIIFPLPPLQEQKRIVAKLDALFEKIDRAIALHQKNMDEADAFMGSVLNDIFGELEKIHGFKKLKNLTHITSSKRVHKLDYVESGIPFYRSKEIILKSKNLNIKDTLYISSESFNSFKNRFGVPQEGEILITAVGTIGVTYLISQGDEFYFKDGNLLWLREISSELNKKYLIYNFNSPQFQKYIDDISKGAAQKALTITKLNELRIPLPPLKIQQKTVNYLDKISLHAERVKELQKEKMQYLKALKASILDQAFRGKL